MKSAYDMSRTHNNYFRLLQDARRLIVKLGQPVPDNTIIRCAVAGMEKHRDLVKPIRDYEKEVAVMALRVPPVLATWPHFKTFLGNEITKLEDDQSNLETTAHDANVAQTHQNKEDINGLAGQVLQQDATIQQLKLQLQQALAVVAAQAPLSSAQQPDAAKPLSLEEQFKRLEMKIDYKLKDGSSRRKKQYKGKANAYNEPRNERKNPTSLDYCSTHGFDCGHNNENCPAKGQWHKEGATASDRKGGCRLNCHLIP